MITAYGSVGQAVEAIKAGAFDYIEKPFEQDSIRTIVEKAIGQAAANRMAPRQSLYPASDPEHTGRFGLADGGTLFLDEIGEIPVEMQVKLLRAIQESEFERVGGLKTIKVNVRLITATNRDLEQETQRGNFREDLFYRLN